MVMVGSIKAVGASVDIWSMIQSQYDIGIDGLMSRARSFVYMVLIPAFGSVDNSIMALWFSVSTMFLMPTASESHPGVAVTW